MGWRTGKHNFEQNCLWVFWPPPGTQAAELLAACHHAIVETANKHLKSLSGTWCIINL